MNEFLKKYYDHCGRCWSIKCKKRNKELQQIAKGNVILSTCKICKIYNLLKSLFFLSNSFYFFVRCYKNMNSARVIFFVSLLKCFAVCTTNFPDDVQITNKSKPWDKGIVSFQSFIRTLVRTRDVDPSQNAAILGLDHE